jgi:bis(5'-nucleosyl)-tetraphosphatase (symmetrical)
MATYAIGDVQGCYDELRKLLGEIGFRRGRDKLWFVGDLVNRGPKSLEVLRYRREPRRCRGDGAEANHDLHLSSRNTRAGKKMKEKATFPDVLDAARRAELIDWAALSGQ